MTDDRAKTPRMLLVADHLWEAFATMATEMGSERDALVNQALYTFARLNGFLVPADLKRLASTEPEQRAEPSMRRSTPGHRSAAAGPKTMMVAPDDRPASRPSANAERVAELAQQLGSSVPARVSSSPPPPVELYSAEEPSPVEIDDSLLSEDAMQATSMERPLSLASLGPEESQPVAKKAQISAPNRTLSDTPAMALDPALAAGGSSEPRTGPRTLVLFADGRELDRVVKDRFVIGRGKHCDLIINSGKVSREHAAITRQGGDYFIEDLGSSNGTWHDKRRITRRQIEDGDEYFICAEKLSCALR